MGLTILNTSGGAGGGGGGGVAGGGTGRATLTAHAVLLGEGVSPVNFAVPSAIGQLLLDNGAGADPSFGGLANLIGANTVETNETQGAQTAYSNLTTPGPIVTLTTGSSVVLFFGAVTSRSGGGQTCFISVAVSGATTLAASDTWSVSAASVGAGFNVTSSRAYYLTGLTPGSNVFTVKYKNDSSATWSFSKRHLVVVAL
jgi:hypothetical protein